MSKVINGRKLPLSVEIPLKSNFIYRWIKISSNFSKPKNLSQIYTKSCFPSIISSTISEAVEKFSFSRFNRTFSLGETALALLEASHLRCKVCILICDEGQYCLFKYWTNGKKIYKSLCIPSSTFQCITFIFYRSLSVLKVQVFVNKKYYFWRKSKDGRNWESIWKRLSSVLTLADCDKRETLACCVTKDLRWVAFKDLHLVWASPHKFNNFFSFSVCDVAWKVDMKGY